MIVVAVLATTFTVAPAAAQEPPRSVSEPLDCLSFVRPDVQAASFDWGESFDFPEVFGREPDLGGTFGDDDESGGALAVLLLAIGGAVAGVLYSAFHDNDLTFGGSVV